MKMAMYIMSIFSAQPNVVMFWGVCKFKALQGDQGIIFHVRGFKFNGWVKVVYNEGADLFDVFYLSNDGKMVKKQERVYFDELVNTIDEYVEKTPDYNQKLEKLYSGVVLIQV